jgi:hypothetical protein
LRTLILVVFTCFVLSLGFLAYWWTQPANSKVLGRSEKTDAALPLRDRQTEKPFGPGQNVWVKKYDADTAKIVSRFRADDYQPRNDGWVTVKQPRAQFFLNDGRAISVEGESGEVIMDDNAGKTGMKALAGSRDTPSRGRLYNVVIHMYHDIVRPEEQLDEEYLKSKAKDKPIPAMTITLNNASFDNQTFKIYSEGFGKGKHHVEADQVPVKLVGDDYLFDGRGLVIRWNERDRRLQLLEIAHGEQLTIKHPNSFMKKEEEGSVARFDGLKLDGARLEGPLPEMLAARHRGAAREAIPPTPAPARPTTRRARPAVPKPKITPSTAPPLYRATFYDGVKIVQGADLNVTAQKMSVDFLMQDQGDSRAGKHGKKGAATRPVAGATTRPAGGPTTRPVVAVATTQPAHKTGRTVARKPGAATQPGEAQTPVVITWTGKLVVEPLSVGAENPIKDGEAVVRLEGAPVVATQQGSTIYSGSLTYRTEDQAMLLAPMAPDKPVVMTDIKGSVVHTTRMDFFRPKQQAILYGASDALFPQQDETGKAAAPLMAKWSKTCTLYFASGEGGSGGAASQSMNIERAELDGDVFVDHPQIKLKSQALELAFDTSKAEKGGAATRPTTRPVVAMSATRPTSAPATQPAIRSDLKQLVATGAVHCEMTDSAKKTQTIDCNRLTLQTAKGADGKIYPNTVNADGDVHAVDPDQDLRAGHLAVNLQPSTQPSKSGGQGANAELQSLIAHQDVKVISKDGTTTYSDQLLIDSKNGHNDVKLLGQPAKIVDKKNTLTGSVIEIFPDRQQLQIVGNGTMKGMQQEKAGEAERPIDVTWNRGMVFDGKQNVVDITGQVVAVTKDAQGATNTAKGDRVRMILADAAPTTKPSKATTQAVAGQAVGQPAAVVAMATSQPATRPSKGEYGGMASKNVKSIRFDDSAEITSVTLADDGSLLRRTHLEAATVDYDMLLKKLLVPVEGRMIVEDHRPAATQPVAGANAADANARPAGASVEQGAQNNRGSTAFAWTRQFTYDDAAHQAVMEGDAARPVVVVHRDDSPKAQLFRLTGETVTADLEAAPATQPSVKMNNPATKPVDPETRVQLKRVTATGHVLFTGPGAQMNALYMEYDPVTHWLIARGNERELVDFSVASQPGGSKRAEEVQYNLDSGEVRATKMSVRLGR